MYTDSVCLFQFLDIIFGAGLFKITRVLPCLRLAVLQRGLSHCSPRRCAPSPFPPQGRASSRGALLLSRGQPLWTLTLTSGKILELLKRSLVQTENKVSQKVPVCFRTDKSYQTTLMVSDRIKRLMNKLSLQRQPRAEGLLEAGSHH